MNFRILVRSVAAGALLCTAAFAQPVTVKAGDDGWVTPENGSQVDLSGLPIQLLVPGATAMTPTLLHLKGEPLDPANLGPVDTIVRRLTDAYLPTLGSTDKIPVRVEALRMVATSDVTLTISGEDRRYAVKVCLSKKKESNGEIDPIKLLFPDGGVFDSKFEVIPRFIFTNVENPSDVHVFDCGKLPCPPNVLTAHNVCWVVSDGPNHFSPDSRGIQRIPPDVTLDADCDGEDDYKTAGSSNFYAGWSPVPPFYTCTYSSGGGNGGPVGPGTTPPPGGGTPGGPGTPGTMHQHEIYGQNPSAHSVLPPAPCALSGACAPPPPTCQGGWINATLKNASGNALASAKVLLEDSKKVGRELFANPVGIVRVCVKTGRYDLSTVSDVFAGRLEQIEVKEGETTSVEISVQSKAKP